MHPALFDAAVQAIRFVSLGDVCLARGKASHCGPPGATALRVRLARTARPRGGLPEPLAEPGAPVLSVTLCFSGLSR